MRRLKPNDARERARAPRPPKVRECEREPRVKTPRVRVAGCRFIDEHLFMAPGIIILIIYFLAVALTGEAFISERESGLLDR